MNVETDLTDVWPFLMENGTEGREFVVMCPVCHHDYSHQGWCAVFARQDGEDGRSYVTGIPYGVDVPDFGVNPSPRRHGLRVEIDGECGHRWYITIMQHKGQTFIGCEASHSMMMGEEATK